MSRYEAQHPRLSITAEAKTQGSKPASQYHCKSQDVGLETPISAELDVRVSIP